MTKRTPRNETPGAKRSGGRPRFGLSLGQPDRHDVESAARMYLEYDAAGLLTDDVAEMFAMSVEDYEAVHRRAAEMKREGNVEDE